MKSPFTTTLNQSTSSTSSNNAKTNSSTKPSSTTYHINNYLNDFPEYLSFINSLSDSFNASYQLNISKNIISVFISQLSSITNDTVNSIASNIRHIIQSKRKLYIPSITLCKPVPLLMCVVSLLHMPLITSGRVIEFTSKKNVIQLQSYLNKLLGRLLYSDIISITECEMFMQLMNVLYCNEKSIIMSFKLFIIILKNITTCTTGISVESKTKFISKYLTSITSQIRNNLNYYYYISSTSLMLHLLNEAHNYEQSKAQIISFLTFIYNNRFHQKHLSTIYNMLKPYIVNINNIQNTKFNISLQMISNQLQLFTEFMKETDVTTTTTQQSLIQIDSGFIFNETNESNFNSIGFDYGPIHLSKSDKHSLCFFITFKVFDTTNDAVKPIITLSEFSTGKDHNILIIYQHKNNIYLKLLNRTISLNETFICSNDLQIGTNVTPMKDVFLILNYSNPLIGKAHFTTYMRVNGATLIKYVNTNISFDNMDMIKCKVGYYVAKNKDVYCFYGVIGSIEVFGCDIDKKFCENLEMNFLVYKYFLTHYNDKQSECEYENYFSCSKEREGKINDEFIDKACSQSKLKEKLLTVISTNVVSNRYNVDKMKIVNHVCYNNLNYRGEFHFKKVPEPETGGVFVYKSDEPFIDVFMQHEGIEYILLCFEYMYSVYNSTNNIDLTLCVNQT